jgi:type IV pilus assembly protein PilC
VIVGGLVFGYKQYYKTTIGKLTMDRFFLKMPILGDLNEKSATARFCRIFGTLTRSGVPILNSLDIVRDTAGNQVISNAIEKSKLEVQQGGMLSNALKALTSVLEPIMMVFLAGMVAVILLSMYLPMFKVFEKLG